MKYYTLTIVNLRQETNDTVTVSFKQPALRKIKYVPGQYLTLVLRINGRRYIRPYSFSSAPDIDSTLDITVKRVPGGIVSNHLIDKVKIGDSIETIEPMGDFIFSENQIEKNNHLILWGAGSGITPLISLAKHALHKKLFDHVTLVYGNRCMESVIFYDTITSLKNNYPDHVTTWHFYTQTEVDDSNPYVIQGRIDPSIVLSILDEEGSIQNTLHYICGPVGLKESVKNVLFDLNVKKENIFSEDFELTRDPKDFENIVTQTVKIIKDDERKEVEVVKGKSILEAGLDSLIELSYSCQTGSCLLCKAKLNSGKIKMIGIDHISESLNKDECLLCCSFPLTEDVEVTVLNN